jgi:hypothetical protein
MAIRISFEENEGEKNLQSLANWLRDEPALRHHAKITLESAPPLPGHLGVPFEAIQLAIDSGFSLANLAIAFSTWRRSRPQAPTPTIIVNGVVMLDGAELDPGKIAQQLRDGGVEDGAAKP